jgi:hypothetical protein
MSVVSGRAAACRGGAEGMIIPRDHENGHAEHGNRVGFEAAGEVDRMVGKKRGVRFDWLGR